MAAILVAVLIVLVVSHTLPDLSRLRNFAWLESWVSTCAQWFGSGGFWQTGVSAVVVIGIPLAALGLLLWLLGDSAFGLARFALATLVLFYCWGPRDLDLDVEAIATAADDERRAAALQALPNQPPQPPLPLQSEVVIDQIFLASLSRWFGVLFWFLLLGPVGALLYRLAQILSSHSVIGNELSDAQRSILQRLADVLNWPAAQLMTLGLAIAGSFDTVLAAWRDFHASQDKPSYITLNLGFLTAAARASVDASVEEEIEESDDGIASHIGVLAEMQQAMMMVWRVLIVWMAFFAMLVLASAIG